VDINVIQTLPEHSENTNTLGVGSVALPSPSQNVIAEARNQRMGAEKKKTREEK